MEWKNDLRRTQSVRSIPSSCDKPAWTATGLRDRAISVSQLVARYQTEVEVGTQIGASSGGNAAGMTKPPLSEMTPPSRQSTGTHLESPTRKNEVRELVPAKANLTRSKSTGSLQSTTRSIEALKTLFETKSTAKNKVKSDFKAAGITPRHTADVPVMNGEAEDVQVAAEQQKVPAGKNTKKDAKEDHERKKVVNQIERRKTIGGVDFEKIRASEADEKRRSIADFRNSSFIQTKETLSVSVKAMSALYLSKVANQESKQALSKPEQDRPSETGKKAKLTKFQPVSQEMCSACVKPVYQMEKITAGKHTFHKTCFCCKKCKKKLSMYSYAPLNGELYCIFHYQQLFKRKGNYDEGFGLPQHKNRWLLRNNTGVGSNESEA